MSLFSIKKTLYENNNYEIKLGHFKKFIWTYKEYLVTDALNITIPLETIDYYKMKCKLCQQEISFKIIGKNIIHKKRLKIFKLFLISIVPFPIGILLIFLPSLINYIFGIEFNFLKNTIYLWCSISLMIIGVPLLILAYFLHWYSVSLYDSELMFKVIRDNNKLFGVKMHKVFGIKTDFK
jgi:hypothetical protein